MTELRFCPATVFLATAEPSRSLAFYASVLGLELVEDNDWALVFALKDAELRVSKVREVTPQPWTVLDWQVLDLDATHATLTQRGVVWARFEGMGQDARGIWTVPDDGTRIAWFRDPDGHVLSVSQRA